MDMSTRLQWAWLGRCGRIAALTLLACRIASADAATAATLFWEGDVGERWNDGVVGVNTNWTDGTSQAKPQDGDTLIFPDGAAQKMVINDIAGLNLQAITIVTGPGGSGYAISGEGITLSGPNGLTFFADEDAFFVIPITLGGDTRLVSNGTGTGHFGAIDLHGFGVVADAVTGSLRQFSFPFGPIGLGPQPVTGAGTIAKVGAGTLFLAWGNTYTGQTFVNAGFLAALAPTALGAAGAGNETIVAAGATLRIDAPVTIPESLILSGHGVAGTGVLQTSVSGVHGVAGTITLASVGLGAETRFGVATPQGLLDVSGQIQGDLKWLSKVGPGVLQVSHASNTWDHALVYAGALRVGTPGALPDTASLTLDGGTLDVNSISESIGTLGGAPGSTIVLGSGTLSVTQSAPGTFNGTIMGTGGLVLNAPGGPLVLDPVVSNSFTGTTTVLAGSLVLRGAAGTTAISGDLVVGRGGDLVSGATVNVAAGAGIAATSTVQVLRDGYLFVSTPHPSAYRALILNGDNARAQVGINTRLTLGHLTMHGAHMTVDAGGTLVLNGDVSARPGAQQPARIDGAGIVSFGGATRLFAVERGSLDDADLIVGLPMVGAGAEGLAKSGHGFMELAAVNTYVGTTAVMGGGLVVSVDSGLSSLSVLEVSGGAEVALLQSTTQEVAAVRLIDGTIFGTGLLVTTTSADIEVRKGTIDVPMQRGVPIAGGLRKTTGETVTLQALLLPYGPTVIEAGTLVVQGELGGGLSGLEGHVHLIDGVLAGEGRVPAILAEGGTLAPGEPGRGGTLRADAVTLNVAATLAIDLHRSEQGSVDQLVVINGPVRLGDAALTISSSLAASPSTTFVIVANLGGSPIDGTFADLPEGARFSRGGRDYRITYRGGDGDDVALTDLGPSPITYFLAEGATGGFFDDDVLIANPHETAAAVTLTFFKEDGGTVVQQQNVAAQSRLTVHVDQIAGLEATAASAQVVSEFGLPLVVERSLFWDASYYGGHTAGPVTERARRWLFAEGSQGFFDTYVLIVNPNDVPTDVTLTFLREGESPVVKTHRLAAASRLTVHAGSFSELIGRAFGIVVDATEPVATERAMYFGTTDTRLWSGGHATTGTAVPSQTWFHAEGATGAFFDTFLLLSNPQDTPARVTLDYLLDGGDVVTVAKTVPAHGRLTVNIEAEDEARLANAAVSTRVTSDVPIVSERSMYWPGGERPWSEAHNSAGLTRLGTTWGLSEGRVGGPLNVQTFVLIMNPQPTAAEVTVTWLRESGAPIVKTYVVPATSRFNIDVRSFVPELQNESFGAIVVVTNDVEIGVERSMYWDVDGVLWSGGTNATAMRLSTHQVMPAPQ